MTAKYNEQNSQTAFGRENERKKKMGMFDKQQTNQPIQQAYDQAAPRGMSPYDRIANAEGQSGGIYPDPGLYPILYTDALKMIVSRKGLDLFIAEFDIVQSEVITRPAGTRMSWMANLTEHDAAAGNVKTFLARLMDVEDSEVGSQEAQYACSADNPCHGRLVRLEASMIKTKTKKNDFTLCKWFAVPKDVQDQAEDLRKKAGFTPF